MQLPKAVYAALNYRQRLPLPTNCGIYHNKINTNLLYASMVIAREAKPAFSRGISNIKLVIAFAFANDNAARRVETTRAVASLLTDVRKG